MISRPAAAIPAAGRSGEDLMHEDPTIHLLPERDRAMGTTYEQPLPGKPTGEATSTFDGVHEQPLGGSEGPTGEATNRIIVDNTPDAERELVTKPVTARAKGKPSGGGQATTK